MIRFLSILLIAGVFLLMGCGEAPRQTGDADTDTDAPVEPPEEVLVISVLPDPGNLVNYRGDIDEIYYFEVTGSDMGSVWGTDIYTDDSNLATAAVHAGVLEPGESDIVAVTILDGEEAYTGSEQNGISSWDYGPWSGSYAVEELTGNYEIAAAADPGNLVSYRDQTGESFSFLVTGSDEGSVWGTDIYTDDSNLATAAVHAGVLSVGETGVVIVTILPGQESYEGSTWNNVTSWDYGVWSGSYMVEPE